MHNMYIMKWKVTFYFVILTISMYCYLLQPEFSYTFIRIYSQTTEKHMAQSFFYYRDFIPYDYKLYSEISDFELIEMFYIYTSVIIIY